MSHCPHCAVENFEGGTSCPFCFHDLPPVYLGGQGRDADDVRFDASVFLSLLAFALLLLCFVYANTAGTAQ